MGMKYCPLCYPSLFEQLLRTLFEYYLVPWHHLIKVAFAEPEGLEGISVCFSAKRGCELLQCLVLH